jgi:hypothetical protein
MSTHNVNSSILDGFVLVEVQLVSISNYCVYKNGAPVMINKTNFKALIEGRRGIALNVKIIMTPFSYI